MSIFVILSKTDNNRIETAILNNFPNDYYKISPGQWMVSVEGTARQVSEKIGITKEEHGPGPAIILAISGYYGRWSSELWEWMKNKLEKGND